MIREFDVSLGDGRVLHAYDTGTGNLAVFWHHGTPNIGTPPRPLFEASQRLGIRWVSYDRPGYGGSTPRHGRSIATAAEYVAAVADSLGIDRFAVMGHSGGGPHALACAALLGGRVVAAATLASVAPRVDGIDFLGGMGEDNAREFEAAFAGEAQLRALLEGLKGGDDVNELESLFSPVGAYLMDGIHAGTAPGLDGWIDDDLAFVAPWGFDVGDISVPVQVWQGRQDRMVPYAHGVWLARRLPRVDVRMSPDDGHITLMERRVADIHAFLAQRF
jgi:pimeloyl-ACP methyl ester carboxylesterase